VALGLAATVPPVPLTALVGGLAVAGLGLSRSAAFTAGGHGEGAWHGPGFPGGTSGGLVVGLAAMAALALLAWALQQLPGPLDLASGLFGDPALLPRLLSLRLAVFTTAVGLLALAVPRDPESPSSAPVEPGDRWGWAAAGLLAAGGALHDTPLAGVPLLLAGGVSAGLWLSGRRRLSRAGALATLGCLAAMAAAGAWETVYRLELRQGLSQELLPRMAPPSAEEQKALGEDLEIFFAATDLEAVVPRPPAGLEIQDLAFTLWKRSPLARSDALSALVVETADGSRSTFSFGLPLDENGLLERREGRWEEIYLPVWKDRIVDGTARLGAGGKPWATARWWLYLQPGFRLRDGRRLEDIEAGLLAGLPRADRSVEGLPAPAAYALYDSEGRVLRSPWDDAPQMAAEVARGETVKVGTPAGWSWAFPRRGSDGWEVLYLPVLGPLAALERVATHAVSNLMLVGALTLAVMLLALPRPAFRELLRRTVRSYSRRLILVHTALVLLPLVSVNVLLVAAAEERLQREQRAAGEAALSSLQRLLGDFLRDLDPGVSLQTELDNDYMTLLSRVVHHEVNLYWQSAVFVSSRSELFTAGLLPKRIPGEIYSRLALLGHELGSRTNRVGDTPYLELYAPFKVGGVPVGEFFFSVPLLAQQAEVARELAALRRQVLLVTVAIFGLMIAVGLRLARSFSEPLMELVAGTRRIAAGAASLDLAPSELELAALVEAIDDMARRLAEGRHKLLREKEVVERMVDNITSGVVSLDRERRVLMRNRVAADLLGVEVGERLDRPRADAAQPAAVTELVAASGSELRQKTVRLSGEGGEEREWSLVWVPVPGSGEPAALLVVEDATEVLRGQRLEAWAEMARIIAHEIKNPLTPIRLNAEHLHQVWATDSAHFNQVFERCVENILHQVDELQQIAAEFSTYSSILHIERRPDDLVDAMRELAEPYRVASAGGVAVSFEASEGELPARFDRRLLSRAVRNLIENALRAGRGGGEEPAEPVVTLRVEASGGTARVSVLDRGPGVEPELLHRIFDPYFSTHDTGTGLGLPIARRVAEEHGGTIAAKNRPEGGLEVVITLPLG
jgi:signal transduction histidine kinase